MTIPKSDNPLVKCDICPRIGSHISDDNNILWFPPPKMLTLDADFAPVTTTQWFDTFF